jgi:hypothetical protein
LNVGWIIGTTVLESDDATEDSNVVITVKSAKEGTLLNATSDLATDTSVALSLVELTTSALTNATNPNDGIRLPAGESANVVTAENGTLKVVSTPKQSKTRVHWL